MVEVVSDCNCGSDLELAVVEPVVEAVSDLVLLVGVLFFSVQILFIISLSMIGQETEKI